MGSKKKQVVGYRYFLGLHMGIGRGPIDELVEIKVGDRTAWAGSITASGSTIIDKPELFGGDEKEGGIDGTLDVMMGEAAQPVNAALAQMLGGLVCAFRGVTTLFFDGLVCSGSPYPKPWKMRVRRAVKGWDGDPWYPEKAVVSLASGAIKAMNPAHMLYECYTNLDWGRGLARSKMNDAAWRAAADQLHSEGFGLCMRWLRQDSLSAFMQSVLDHVGAAQYVERQTGLVTLKLIRADYDPESLPLFDADSGLLGIDDDAAAAQTSSTNELIVTYRNPLTNEDGQVRVKNLAAIHSAGGAVSSSSKEYPGLPTAELALRVAQRDLKATSGFIKRFKVRLDRRAFALMPADVFRIRDLRRGIDNVIVRAGRVEWGTLGEGTITVDALQDVFGLPATSYVSVQPPGWVAPDTSPLPAVHRRLIEVPYRDIVQMVAPADQVLIPGTAGYLGAVAVRPSVLSEGFDLVARVGSSGAFVLEADGAFCPSATIVAVASKQAASVTLVGGDSLRDVEVGTAALIGDEVVRVDSIDLVSGVLGIARGCGDTVPAEHAAGARIYFFDTFIAAGTTEYSSGVTVQAKLLTRTAAGRLAEVDATTDSLTFAQRQYRPYPPGRFRINGLTAPASAIGNVVVTWSHRDRLLQDDQLIDTEQASIGPEAGTTYTVRMRRVDTNAVIDEEVGVSGTSATLTSTYTGAVVVELLAERGGIQSWQPHRHQLSYAPA